MERVLGSHEPLLDRGGQTALEEDGHARLADFLQQLEVLHVPRTDLEHVDVAGHHLDVLGADDLGRHRHAELVAGLPEVLEALLSQPLEGIGGGARLEGAAPQDDGSGPAYSLGDLHDLLLALDGAGSGHHDDTVATDPHVADTDDRVLLLQLAACKLVGLRDRDDGGDTIHELDLAGVHAVHADGAEDGVLLALYLLDDQAVLLEEGLDLIFLLLCYVLSEDDYHGGNAIFIAAFLQRDGTGASRPFLLER